MMSLLFIQLRWKRGLFIQLHKNFICSPGVNSLVSLGKQALYCTVTLESTALTRAEQGFSHKEYKGTPPQNGRTAVFRVLSIAVKGGNVYIGLKTVPGKLTNMGAITPNGKPEVEVNVDFKLYETRRMAASVLTYIHAWDMMRMLCHHKVVDQKQLVSQPLKYGNGDMVDGKNFTEVQTFHHYMAEKKATPESKSVLLDYYRQFMQPPSVSP